MTLKISKQHGQIIQRRNKLQPTAIPIYLRQNLHAQYVVRDTYIRMHNASSVALGNHIRKCRLFYHITSSIIHQYCAPVPE